MFRKSKSGFTLVEILIVVIILGILAAIVIPQFTGASQEARASSLVSQLQTLRSQILLYKTQHNETLPVLAGGSDDLNDSTKSVTTNWDALTKMVMVNGKNLGPYMQAPPKNPLNGRGAVVDGDGTADAATPCGFVYDYTGGTGRIWGTDKDGKAIYKE